MRSLNPRTSTESNRAGPTRAAASVSLGPSEHGRRCWAKIVRSGSALPLPSDVTGARCIPGRFLPNGEDDLFGGDVLFEGEQHEDGRWEYRATMLTSDGAAVQFSSNADAKARLKQRGLSPALWAGSGELADLVRIAHALRLGLNPFPDWATALVSAVALSGCVDSPEFRTSRPRL